MVLEGIFPITEILVTSVALIKACSWFEKDKAACWRLEVAVGLVEEIDQTEKRGQRDQDQTEDQQGAEVRQQPSYNLEQMLQLYLSL